MPAARRTTHDTEAITMQIGGIDADTIVTQLMQVERLPLNALQARRDASKTAAEAINKIRSSLDAFRLASARLGELANFDRFKATASNPDSVSAVVSGTANIGTLTFSVDRLALAHGLRSVGSVATDSTTATSQAYVSIAAGTRSIGVDTVRAGAGLTAGTLSMKVTQASAGATTSGVALATSTVVDGTNNSFQIEIDGVAHAVTLASGTYDRAALVDAAQTALDTAGVGVTAGLDGSGALQLTSVREGSSTSLRVVSGTALSDLGLSAMTTASTGTDGVVDIAGNLTTVTSAQSGQAVALGTGSGTLDVVLSGGLRVGASTVTTVSTGSRSLADVVAAVNGANAGVSAAAVKVGTGAWRLQLTSRTTGDQGRIALDDAVFDGLGGLVESSAAQNAAITIGSGPGAYSVESSSNTFTDVLAGVSLVAKTVSATPVTVDVSRNDDAVAGDIAKMVGAANTLLAEIKVQMRFDPATGAAGALVGNSAVRRLAEDVRAALGGQVAGLGGTPTKGLASSIGIQLGRDGSFTFDQAKFMSAVTADPSAVARLFSRGGTSTGDATFATATAETAHGTYAVNVTTAAAQATTGTLFSGGAASSSRLGFRVGSTTATVDITGGQTAAQVIESLNNSFAGAGLDLTAEVDGTGLRVRANGWGAAGDFELNDDLLGIGVWNPLVGADVQGTINGVSANGSGRRLTLSALVGDRAAGLSIDVTGGLTGAVGSVTYEPGIGARVVEVATALTRDETGVLTSAKDGADRRTKAFTDQMTRLEDRLTIREANMRRQWANLQTLLANLQNQGSWVSSQLASLPTIGR
jgi:flagellar hook-associated protein 2